MLGLYAGCALVSACTLLYLFLRHRFTYWQRRKVPFAEPTAPFGNYSPAILGKKALFEVANDLYRRHAHERYIGTYFMAAPMLQIHDPEIIRHVFIKEFHDFNARGMYWDAEKDPLSGHLFSLGGQPWRNMRVKLSPTFSSGKIKYMFSTITECADHLAGHIESSLKRGGGQYVDDARELLARYATDVISSVAFGIESNSMKNPNSEFRLMGQRIFEPCFNVNIRHLLSFFGGGLMKAFSIRSVPAHVDEFFRRLVAEMLQHRRDNNVERADMLNLLIKLKREGFLPPDAGDEKQHSNGATNGVTNGGATNGTAKADGDARESLTDSQITAQVFVFFVAGYETTSSASGFMLFELAKNPDVQEKLVEEVDAVLKKHGGKMTYDMLTELTYMDMVIQETLRFYPSVPFLTRESARDRMLPLTDVKLQKGTRLMFPIMALHMDPRYWDEPQRFNPLRFTEEAKKARKPMTFLPFGDGPRICIGMRLAFVQVKMAMVTILSRATVSLTPGMKKDVTMSPRCVLPSPVEGVKLIFKAR